VRSPHAKRNCAIRFNQRGRFPVLTVAVASNESGEQAVHVELTVAVSDSV
jgi:hypothetical protein